MAAIVATISFTAQAQKKDKTVLTIGKETFTLKEFDYIYNKNNPGSLNPMTKEQYLELFVNYKLKVKEACEMGLDTAQQFISELNYYFNELSRPYLTDRKAEDKVIAEAYERIKSDVNASHILILLQHDATPEDTLKAWNKINEAKKELENGADFAKTALKYSEDPSVSNNSGALGWFTAFQMVYPFETAAYKTAPGHISDIVKTSYGYHIIKVHDKRPAAGEILVAHIMKMTPPRATQQQFDEAKQSIDSIYSLIVNGADFAEMARLYSDDGQSAMNDGELPWFSRGRMIEQFSDEAFALRENGEMTTPFRTPFGWHIAKRIDYKPIGSIDDERDNIKERITYDERAQAGVKTLVEKLKKEYSFKVENEILTALSEIIKTEENDSIIIHNSKNLKGNLLSFADKKIEPATFVEYLKGINSLQTSKEEASLRLNLEKFIESQLLDYEKGKLKEKYPDFRYLIQEYHDGLLVFEISQQKIWNKASADTLELKNFYIENINRYSSSQIFTGLIIETNTAKEASALNLKLKNGVKISEKDIDKGEKKGWRIESGSYTKGEDSQIDAKVWPRQSEILHNIVLYGEFKYGEPIEFERIKGTITSDYQNYLEKEWLKELHLKYRPTINRKAVK